MNDENYYKEYINKFIKRQRIISIISIVFILLSSTISVMAVSAYLYNSNEVSYNNNASGITSTNVQGAIDELYEHATDYTSMNTRVSALEGYFKNSPKSYFDDKKLEVGINSSSNSVINLYKNGTKRLALWPNTTNEEVSIAAYSTDGTTNGGLSISGNPIRLSSNDITMNSNYTKIKKINCSTECNTLSITVPTMTYRWINGILITRYGIHTIHVWYDGANNMYAKANTVGVKETETITVSQSGTTASFKSSTSWNNFTLIFTGGHDGNDITFSTSKT